MRASSSGDDEMVPMNPIMLRRLVQLYGGLTLYGTSMALMVRARLGLDPWDVFHSGIAKQVSWSLGTVVIVTGALVLLGWIPLRQRPGLGTISNVFVIGLALDGVSSLMPRIDAMPARVALALGAVALNAVATASYIGASFGPGPRDGLMTGLVRRTGRSVRLVRTSIEVTVLTVGVVLGGSIGVATVVYAFLIGPLVQPLLPLFRVDTDTGEGDADDGVGSSPQGLLVVGDGVV
jgi:uncharacterized membrane protein YczE